ncbi:DUF6259 domain-containing protein [Paenibacillus roseipurpureus]|uniref:DUF6259 domain-containing protein n=1 Tax=Paenibacillus roseopurpureus TaxID=2918901 RepID=A0AA96LKW1_9BACL|nr:DUF6259 domain-containing protein [Paenibacillus sp. MBLB1832]WNR42961.1 DUF6259 domain-containing protein [Paenibacillus sp. MBLB1832]
MKLEVGSIVLSVSENGRLNARSTREMLQDLVLDGYLSWKLVLQQPSKPWLAGKSLTITSTSAAPLLENIKNGISMTYANLGSEEPLSMLFLQIEITIADGDGLNIQTRLRCDHPEWYVKELRGPILNGVNFPRGSVILLPNGLGQRFDDLKSLGSQTLLYPSGRATMPWFTLTASQGGIYFGSHDPEMSARELTITSEEIAGKVACGVHYYIYSHQGVTWSSPPLIVRWYEGSWHTASRYYRSWYDSVASILDTPAWVKQSSGWLLAVLKQQNGDVMWDYRNGIDQLCEIAAARGLDTLGLFGWAHGGHDYLYPNYIPDPLMGGVPEIRAALVRARKRGLRTILYANGVIMDSSTEFYRYQGNDTVLLKENKEPQVSSIRKFNSSTPVTFAQACPGSETWRKQMMSLAIQANELGADGILYDQIGVYGPAFCSSHQHRHISPTTAFTQERRSMIEEIAAHMRSINPEFIVMTEGIHDTLHNGITYVHGWGSGFSPSEAKHNMFSGAASFPKLYRYTFPELPMLQRHSTPMLDRYYANYACFYGLRFEIETRYQPDVKYLCHDQIPQQADYEDVAYYPPDLALMQSVSPEFAKLNLRTMIFFTEKYAAFLRSGRFTDAEGFFIEGDGLLANSFISEGKQLAVLVWNPDVVAKNCKVWAEGMVIQVCAEADSGDVDCSQPIPPQTLRIYLFQHQLA